MGSNSKFQKTLLNTQLHSQVCPPLHTQARPVLAHSSHSWPGMATLAQGEAEVTLGSLCGIPDGKRRPVFLSLFATYPWKPPLHPSSLGISDLSRVSADRWLLLWILTWPSKPAAWVPVVFLPRSFSLLLPWVVAHYARTFSVDLLKLIFQAGTRVSCLVCSSSLSRGWLFQSLLTVS